MKLMGGPATECIESRPSHPDLHLLWFRVFLPPDPPYQGGHCSTLLIRLAVVCKNVRALGSPGLSWALLGYPGLSWALLGFPGLSWAILGSPGLSWAFLGFPGLSWALLGFPGLSWALLGSPGLSWAVLGP